MNQKKISRRNFLGAVPVVAGAVLQFNGIAMGQKPERVAKAILEVDALARLTWDSFYPFIYTDFTFGRGYNAVSLKLVAMTDSQPVGRKRKNASQENFVMKFQGPYNQLLEQGTYQVNHFNLGDFDLFITNGGRVRREQYYIAVINRVTE